MFNWSLVLPVVMLAGSNLVMNFAWYGHLKGPQRVVWLAILLSWGLAFAEYCLVVPATRIGSGVYSLPQLKTIQLFMSATMFFVMAWLVFGTRPGWNEALGFTAICLGAWLVFARPIG